jgi:uncharacterized protein DUF3644
VKRLTRHLLDRSQQAFALALEIFNKPTIAYRIEGFCFFYVNAWNVEQVADLSSKITARNRSQGDHKFEGMAVFTCTKHRPRRREFWRKRGAA